MFSGVLNKKEPMYLTFLLTVLCLLSLSSLLGLLSLSSLFGLLSWGEGANDKLG